MLAEARLDGGASASSARAASPTSSFFARDGALRELITGDRGRLLPDGRLEVLSHLCCDHFGVLFGKNWSGSVEQAIDVALLDRYFERFADHAVAVARRVIYIITGQFPEGEE